MVSGSKIVSEVAFWTINAFFLTLDLTGRPKFLTKYKIQPNENVPINREKVKKAVKQVIFNQTIVAFPVMYIETYLYLWRGCDFGRELPSFHWVLCEIAIFSLIEEFCFYYSHRYEM